MVTLRLVATFFLWYLSTTSGENSLRAKGTKVLAKLDRLSQTGQNASGQIGFSF